MQTAPKSLRLHLGIFGRTNVGKSSFLNLVAGQDTSIISPVPGTTTDVVEKTMELLPLGPVVFHDTAGLDDVTELGAERIRKTLLVFDRADIVVLICEPGVWGDAEADILKRASERALPSVVVVNKTDLQQPSGEFIERLKADGAKAVITGSSIASGQREYFLNTFKSALIDCCPDDFIKPPPLVGDLLPSGGLAVLIVPIDLQAPKGRLILPQVQTIRDALDNDASILVVKEREYAQVYSMLNRKPDLAICDSQVVLKMVADTPADVPCTTFSILFSRLKGDIQLMARGAAAIDTLQPGDKVLIGEACSHHAAADDIGRVKIPRWLRQHVGGDIDFEVSSGRDYPENLAEFKMVIHCGSCMLNRRETLARIHKAAGLGIPVTNYGMCISYVQGVLKRVLTPFPVAMQAFEDAAGETTGSVWQD